MEVETSNNESLKLNGLEVNIISFTFSNHFSGIVITNMRPVHLKVLNEEKQSINKV